MTLTRREAILEATAAAAKLHKKYKMGNRTSFDVMSVVQDLSIPVLFRPLKKLLGAALTIEKDNRGILITTNRDAQVQRFTLAHELGHILFNHNQSLDFEEDIGFTGRSHTSQRPMEEYLVDTFASELLCGKTFIRKCAHQQGWDRAALTTPDIVYQLALRLGVSYQAACWGLASQKLITQAQAKSLSQKKPLELKYKISPKEFLAHSWANTWSLSHRDHGTLLDASPEDVFVVNLHEKASAGYLWDLNKPEPEVEILEERTFETPGQYGALALRTVTLRFTTPGTHRLTFLHKRPWSGEEIGHIDVNINNLGKELPGLPRCVREAALANA